MLKGDTKLLEIAVTGEPGEEIPVRVGFMGDMDVDAIPSSGWFFECEVNGEIFRGEGPTPKEASDAMLASLRAEEEVGAVASCVKRTPHPLAGKHVKIKNANDPNLDGCEFYVEDWWVNVAGQSWKTCDGNPACMAYCGRVIRSGLPLNDEVVYGKIGSFGYLVHDSELVVPRVEGD